MNDSPTVPEKMNLLREKIRQLGWPICKGSVDEIMPLISTALAEAERRGIERSMAVACFHCRDGVPLSPASADRARIAGQCWSLYHAGDRFCHASQIHCLLLPSPAEPTT